jgi:DNA-binding response OmpR family regulator
MKEKPVVLVVDDEAKILELIRSYLGINGYTPLCAQNGREGLKLFEQNPVSLVLLDLMLPDVPGEEVCRKIREISQAPIIMLTAKVEEEDIIRGLKMGADDYITKPFSPRQLMARVEAALRRSGGGKTGTILSYAGLTIDTENRAVSLNGEALGLTRDEYNILTLLMSRQPKIFTRDEILESIKGGEYDGFDRSIDTHIKKLRAKLGDDPRAPGYITTVYGMGYRFGAER